ncbi:MAG TPA: sugar phosphate isomerase/epimerase [Bryobacteraceae bacterium]|nr:sugar phosphate isomerase/epimerase [Bryobacteraceae bacterium]
MPRDCTRRSALVAMAGAPALAASAPRAIRLGGPVFLKSSDPAELAREHRRLGYSAAYCPEVKLEDAARLREIERAFAAENVVIAEVGAWVNLLDPDADKRRENLRTVTSRLAVAEAVGARCCVDIAGSFNPKIWFGPEPRNLSREFFDATVENCRRIIDEVRPKRTTFALEMMGWALPDGPDSYLELIRAIDRPRFGVHIDVCNVINSPSRFYYNRKVIAECFEKLGSRVVSCHAKDLAWTVEMNVHFVEVVPGRGEVDYSEYLRQIAGLPVEAPLMLEHLKTAEEYEEGKQYIRRVARSLGLAFA